MAARKIQPHKSKRKSCKTCGKLHSEAQHASHYWPIRKKKAVKKKKARK